jgi:hypothetical protein
MGAELLIRNKGMTALITALGKVEAEKFITYVIREPFDYTEWHNELFNGLTVDELNELAMKNYEDK